MAVSNLDDFVRAGSLEELRDRGCTVVSGTDRPIAVFCHDGQVHAVDNRCPHLGFPLSKGTVKDGILTCHWHHARFDMVSGCTFDLFADDVPSCPVEMRDGEIWVSSRAVYADGADHWKNRLRQGMENTIGLVIAKAILGMLRAGTDYREIVKTAVLFGARNRDGWDAGLTILTALANVCSYQPGEGSYLPLYTGVRRVAESCAGQAPRRDRYPLGDESTDPVTLKRWFRQWTLVRHRDGAERTLLTALQDAGPAEAADLLFSAATDRYYADGGHTLDFINKAFEALELMGWEYAADILPTVVRQLVGARGGEEMDQWRQPSDLHGLQQQTFQELPSLLEKGRSRPEPVDPVQLAEDMLADDPAAIVNSLKDAIRRGIAPVDLSRALAYAAVVRIARFGTSNEFGDWITALHTFTYTNALHQAIKRMSSAGDVPPDVLRGVFHGAMSVYLDRFLNIPAARLPGERDSLDDLPSDERELLAGFLEALNSQQQVDEAARLVARYLECGGPAEPLIGAMIQAVVREDADFHTYQMLEAGIRQYEEWGNTREGKTILIAMARYIAAHSPTQRASLQTAQIALRLHSGEAMYEEV